MSLLFKVWELLTFSCGTVCSQRQARFYLQGGIGRVALPGRVTRAPGSPYDLDSVTTELHSSDCPAIIFRLPLKKNENASRRLVFSHANNWSVCEA